MNSYCHVLLFYSHGERPLATPRRPGWLATLRTIPWLLLAKSLPRGRIDSMWPGDRAMRALQEAGSAMLPAKVAMGRSSASHGAALPRGRVEHRQVDSRGRYGCLLAVIARCDAAPSGGGARLIYVIEGRWRHRSDQRRRDAASGRPNFFSQRKRNRRCVWNRRGVAWGRWGRAHTRARTPRATRHPPEPPGVW